LRKKAKIGASQSKNGASKVAIKVILRRRSLVLWLKTVDYTPLSCRFMPTMVGFAQKRAVSRRKAGEFAPFCAFCCQS
jgi:hypothetical protein